MYQDFFVCVSVLLGIEPRPLHMPAPSPSQVGSGQMLPWQALRFDCQAGCPAVAASGLPSRRFSQPFMTP